MAKNTKMLVKRGVVVVRKGERVRPTIGKEFSFSEEEIEGIMAADPGALTTGSEEDEGETATAATTTSSAEKSQAKARGGRKAATANKSDAEVENEGEEATDPTGDDDL